MTILRTERLTLRTWTLDDLDELVDVFAEPRVWWFPLRRGLAPEEVQTFLSRRIAEWEGQGWGHWAVIFNGALVGYTGFAYPTFLPEVMPVPEIGWRLHPSVWGQGLATEAAVAALEHGFGALGFDQVVSIYEPDNVASGRVMARIGMTVDRETVHPDFGVPLRVYRLRAADWQPRSS